MFAAKSRLLTSLTASAEPRSPVGCTGSAYAATAAAHRCTAAASPPSRTSSLPARMASAVPLTGASTTSTPLLRPRSSSCRRSATLPVVCDANTAPPGRASMIEGPTSASCLSSNRQDRKTSAPAAAAAGSSTTTAPRAVSRSRTSGRRTYTETECPASSIRSTMGSPIRPAPMKPTVLMSPPRYNDDPVTVLRTATGHPSGSERGLLRPALDVATGVDAHLHARDVARLVRHQEEHRVRDVLGLHIRDRHGLHRREGDDRVVAGGLLQVGPEDPVHGVVVQQVGVAVGRVHRVGPDLLRRQGDRQVVHERGDEALRQRVPQTPGTRGRVVDTSGQQRR